MNVAFHPDVHKQLQGPPRTVFAAAMRAIIGLTQDPRPAGVKKVAGSRADWRLRIGEYRIIYETDDQAETVTVMRVAHRRESYR